MPKAISATLSLLALGLVFQAQSASAQAPSTNNSLERMKTQVHRYGTGNKAKVVVRKSDGTKVKGYISSTGDDAFELTDVKTKRTSTLAYTDVSKISKQGMPKGAKIAIIAGVAVAVVVVVAAVAVGQALDCFMGCAP